MRIVHLTPGTGSFYCGSCLRDHDLVKRLRAMGHDVIMVPLYLPFVADEPLEDDVGPVFLGGVNMFLQQKSGIFRHTPRFVDKIFDREGMLKSASKKAGMTNARVLGEMTLSSFMGTEGKQRKEYKRLIKWLKSEPEADVFSLSNGLLTSIAVALKEEFGKPVVCTLHGEDSFLDTLPYPYREQCWEKFQENSKSVDRYVAVSNYYMEEMQRRLNVSFDQMDTVWNGVDLEKFKLRRKKPEGRSVGFLARMIKGKGLDTLVEAFMVLKATGQADDVKLKIAGTMTEADEDFVEGLKKTLADAKLDSVVEFLPNISLQEKIDFLNSLTVLSVPATYGESFGLYLIEAMACGVPVVQPDHAVFPEIIRETGGGLLCEAENSIALAGALQDVLSNPDLAARLGKEGRKSVEKNFNAQKMAERFLDVCARVSRENKKGAKKA